MTKAGLVIGAGVAGIQAALSLANQGFTVYVVEKNPSIGGRVAQLDKMFPKLNCATCIVMPQMMDVARHPNIELLAYSEVKEVWREGKNFRVKIVRKPRFVDESRCTGCGVCAQHCPVEVPNEFDEKIGIRKAIYVPFPQAVPLIYTVDTDHCLQCELCKNVCKTGAIDHLQRPEMTDVDVGAIIVTTGYDLHDARRNHEYGFGRFDNVITGLALERLLNVSGPTGGHVVRLSDGKIPRKVAFIQCVGPRDEKLGNVYCSKVCCMYATKQAELLKKRVPGVDVSIYYSDAQAFDKKFDEFYQKARSDFGIRYVKAEVNAVQEKLSNNNLLVQARNVDSGEIIENEVDLLVLSTGLVPTASEFAKILPLKVDDGNFFVTVDPKMDDVTTNVNGVFVAGVAEAPKDISESIAQADTAAAKAAGFLRSELSA